MLGAPATAVLSLLTGVALEIGVHALSGRREAWDSPLFWALGLPLAALVSGTLGYLANRRAWIWTLLIVPGQVTAMVVRSGELGGLWPLMVALSAILSAPFVFVAFVASMLRPRQAPPR
jgi:hypothetical protein